MKEKRIWKMSILLFGVGLLLGGMFSTFLLEKTSLFSKSVQVLASDKMQTDRKIQEIDTSKQYKINVYYPYTPYPVLNKEIEKLVQGNIEQLKEATASSPISKHQYYTLDITYDTYEYEDYITYAFTITIYTGGAHPNTTLPTITYQKSTKEIVTIDSLLKKNENLLTVLSEESRKRLMENKAFQDTYFENIERMFLEGTEPKKENFQNFAFTSEGLLLLFENYQIAPYSYGSFRITIPYASLFS